MFLYRCQVLCDFVLKFICEIIKILLKVQLWIRVLFFETKLLRDQAQKRPKR